MGAPDCSPVSTPLNPPQVASLMPVDGMMNLYKYIDVIERKAIPVMRKAFPDGGGKFQVIVPCLSSEKAKTISRKQN